MQVEATFTELGAGAARAAHEPLVARPLLAARLREERLRRARVRRRRPGAADNDGRMPYGWNVDGHGGAVTREVQGLRRPRGRDLSRRRHDARAHQHAGGDHVGARARRSAGVGHIRAAGRACSGRSPRSCIRVGAARVHRAESAVPDGQPRRSSGRSRSGSSSIGSQHVPFLAAPHRHRRRARRLREGRREDRPAGGRDLRRVPASTSPAPTRSSPTTCRTRRRRHGAPQQHGDHLGRVDRRRRGATCSTRSRTSSSTAGMSSASGRRGSSRSISIGRTCSGELWLAEGFTQYYGPLVAAARAARGLCARRRGRSRGFDRDRGAEPGHGSCDRPKR